MTRQVILVVTDAREELDAFALRLRSQYQVETVPTRDAALTWAEKRLPDLVVLGSDADHRAFLESWRTNSQTCAVPVLSVLDAGREPPDPEATPGPDDYLLLPLEERLIPTRIRTLLRLSGSEAALRRKEETLSLLDSLISHAPVGFAFFDRQFRYVRINDFLAAINGIPAADHLGRTLREIVPVNAPRVESVLQQVFATGEAVQDLEIAGETPLAPGVTRHWLCSFFPVALGGRTELAGALVLEITDRKRSEETLVQDDRRKDRFLATLAHELRNPLAPIRNALEILRAPEASAADAAYARDLLERQVRQMVRLIDDLLDVSRLRVGRIELKREQVALDNVINAALETCRPAFDAGGQELKVTLPPQQLVLDADPLRLAQVLANLLHNATKYTGPKGRIELSAQVEEKTVVLRVCDSGIGIRKEQLPHVFDMFHQKAPAGTGGRGGLGVGLGLVKALVEQHGGTVAAASEGPGQGSEFTVRLPLAGNELSAFPEPTIPTQPVRPERKRVLVVDDSVDAARSLARLLRLGGNEVQTAHDGVGALEVFPNFHPDVIFLDIGMPRMDGYEVARRIRRLPESERVLLIALTGWGQDEDRRRSREAGFDIHLVKPVEPEQLRELLSHGAKAGAGA